jgi:hypothetical protein
MFICLLLSESLLAQGMGSSQLQRFGHSLIPISIIDENGRMTEEEYAAAKGQSLEDIRDRFAATGRLDCKNSRGTAQLTGDGRTLTMSGHMFVGERNGKFGVSLISSNCDSDHGASGGSLLKAVEGKLILVGVNSGIKHDAPHPNNSYLKNARPDYAVPVYGSFLKELEETIRKNGQS